MASGNVGGEGATSSTGTGEEFSKLQWKIGWYPTAVIVSMGVIGGMVGYILDAFLLFLIMGFIVGAVVWYWGVQEINNKYEELLRSFGIRAKKEAEYSIGTSDPSTYDLTYGNGESPFLVEPSEKYYKTILSLTDVSVNVNKGSEYNMKEMEEIFGGTNNEIYYDQISGIDTYQDGDFTFLEIQTAGTEDLRVRSTNTNTLNQLVSELREEVRRVKK